MSGLQTVARDSDRMTFGKHKGERLADVPASYLLWCYRELELIRKYPGLRAYIEKNLRRLQAEAR